jgi:hypothetical protein
MEGQRGVLKLHVFRPARERQSSCFPAARGASSGKSDVGENREGVGRKWEDNEVRSRAPWRSRAGWRGEKTEGRERGCDHGLSRVKGKKAVRGAASGRAQP